MVTRFNSGFTLKDCLFDGIKLTKKKKKKKKMLIQINTYIVVMVLD